MHTSLKAWLRLLPAALLLFFAGLAHAQFNASLSGSVLDSTQAAIPGATVTLTNNQTNSIKTVKSSESGTFTFSSLSPGTYKLAVTATGFQQNVIPNVPVAAETPATVNVTLSPGSESQTITVDANTIPLLQTSDASIGTTIDGAEVQRLPIVGADLYELLRTAPGITGNGARAGSGNAVFLPNGVGPGGSNSGIFQTENQPQISADGQRVADNDYLIDGVSVNSLSHGGAAVVTPNTEAVGQMTVVSTSYDASLGRNTGAQIQVVTKAGTNQIHGSALFLYDDPGINSFNKYGGPGTNVPFVRNQNAQRTWAASIGGPIVKDKLFLFASYQAYKETNPTYTNLYVETPQYRSAIGTNRIGGVSAAIVAANSAPRIVSVLATPSNACNGYRTFTVVTPFTANGTTYATGSQAPACQIVSGGLDIGSLTPGGTSQRGVFPSGTAIGTAPYYGASPFLVGGGFDGTPDLEYVQVRLPQQSRGSQYNGRIDFQLTPHDLIAASAYFTKLDNLGGSGAEGSRPQGDVPFKPFNSAATLIYIHTFSPSWLNEARANVTRFADNELNDGGNTVNYGIPYVNVQDYPGSCCQFGVNQSTTTPASFAENTYEVRDTVTHNWGAHTIRAGIEARFEQDNDNLYGAERPVYAFDGLWAFANDTSVYESLTVNPNTGAPANEARYFRDEDYAVFVQHDWKVTPTFTFNTGLRWEEFTPPANKGMAVNKPLLGPAGSELAGLSLITTNHLWNFQHNNWSPKVGFEWSFAPKMVVRAGFGIAYNNLDAATYSPMVEDGPGVANFGLCCGGNGNTAGIIYNLGTSNSPSSFPINKNVAVGTKPNGIPNLPNNAQIEVYGVANKINYPSADEYSFEIQREFGWGTTATAGYQGASGHHFARFVNQNFLYNQNGTPAFAAYFLQTDSSMNYNALNLRLNHTLRNDIGFSVAYTYGKVLDQVSNGDGADGLANQTNPANNRSEYGPADYDVRHHLTATWLYQTPKIKTGNALLTSLISGFQFNGTYTYTSGFPFTPVTSNYNTVPIVNGAATQNIVRPLAYFGGAGNSCSTNSFEGATAGNFPKGGAAYFQTTLPTGTTYTPGIGRNSFRSSCYQDVDITLAKDFGYDWHEHHTLLRFQANIFNVFNLNEAAPITNDNVHNNVTNSFFGLSPQGDAGRVIELEGRFQF
ncbi:MAG: TonB-dependent receptor [Acidobacteriota bacterium]